MDQSDLRDKVKLNYIGTCPVCGKGQMLQGSAGWTCNHFKDWTELCRFTIFGSYSGYVLEEKDAVDLITKGSTDIHQFRTMEGVPYKGRLCLSEGKVKVVPLHRELAVRCPLCGGKVIETQGGWMCKNYMKGDDGHCPVFIAEQIMGRPVSEEEAVLLLDKRMIGPLDGFIYKGRMFASCLVIDPLKGCRVNGRICKCPKCGGEIYAGTRAYNCSNFRNEDIRCDFVIWRDIRGHEVTPEEVRQLCAGKRTDLIDFTTKEGYHMSRSMIIDDSWNVKLI